MRTVLMFLSFILFICASTSLGQTYAHWKMDEISGDMVADASGNGHTGTAYNAAIGVGKIGNCRNFNGSNSYIDIGTLAYPPTANTGTFSCWFKVNNLADSQQAIIAKSTYFTDVRFSAIFVQLDGSIAYWSKVPNSGGQYDVVDNAGQTTAAGLVQPGVWYHLAITADGVNTIKIYLNGQEQSTNANVHTSGPRFFDYGESWVIGDFFRRTYNPGAHYFDGSIDDVRLNGNTLSATEVMAIFNGGYTQIPTLTEWGLIIFGVLLVGFMTWVFLRRRKTATIGI